MGESKGFDFSPPPRPGRGVVSPLGSQYLSINLISCGMAVVGGREGEGNFVQKGDGVERVSKYKASKTHDPTSDSRLSLAFRIPAIPKPTKNPSKIDWPVVRSPNLSEKK